MKLKSNNNLFELKNYFDTILKTKFFKKAFYYNHISEINIFIIYFLKLIIYNLLISFYSII